MRPLLQHASRSLRCNASFLTSTQPTLRPIRSILQTVSQSPSICLQCQYRASSLLAPGRQRGRTSSALEKIGQRSFSSHKPDAEKPIEPSPVANQTPSEPSQASKSTPQSTPPKDERPITSEGNIKRVPDEALPSHREGQRWNLSKRLTEFMDEVLPKLAVVTQKVNTYTGTDYSGIEALRREIKDQEKLVKARRLAVEDAKQALDAAHAQQAASAKEVVGLLERKHSWSATDLERYMALIRSEHINDQAVHAAKDAVLAIETALEEARSHLEKRERAQYHEEQIWSDTIRRNSTWVTFGLMGLNIFLLLASLLVIEPWRRRRLVREIRSALDAQILALEAQPASATKLQPTSLTAESQSAPNTEIPSALAVEIPSKSTSEESAEEVAEATGTILEDIARAEQSGVLVPEAEEHVPSIEEDIITKMPVGSEESLSDGEPAPALTKETGDTPKEQSTGPAWVTWKNKVILEVQDLFSERTVSIRRVEYTAAVLQGAAAGAFCCALLLQLVRWN